LPGFDLLAELLLMGAAPHDANAGGAVGEEKREIVAMAPVHVHVPEAGDEELLETSMTRAPWGRGEFPAPMEEMRLAVMTTVRSGRGAAAERSMMVTWVRTRVGEEGFCGVCANVERERSTKRVERQVTRRMGPPGGRVRRSITGKGGGSRVVRKRDSSLRGLRSE